jgi:Uma2 family endonuclease
MSTFEPITTARQLFDATGLGRCELVRGELIMMSPSGFEHGIIVARITSALHASVVANRLGVVTGAETGFQIACDPDTVRAPDVGFVIRKRVSERPPIGFFPGAPDLAVEVVSPTDRERQVSSKVREWLDAGCALVWVVNPVACTVTAYYPDKEATILDQTATLSCEDLIPGFTLPIAEIFK